MRCGVQFGASVANRRKVLLVLPWCGQLILKKWGGYMILTEEKIRNWQKSIATISDKMGRDCTAVFISHFNGNELSIPNDLEQAIVAVHEKASTLLISDEMLEVLPNGPSDLSSKESLRASWLSLMPKLSVPVLNAELELFAWSLAVAGALGSLLGMLLIGGLMHWALNMRDAGILFGCTIGAASAVYGAWYTARSRILRAALLTVIGTATIFELFAAFSSLGLGGLWRRLKGSGNLIYRLMIYCGIIVLLVFTRQEYRHDQDHFEKIARCVIEQWVDYGMLLLFNLVATGQSEIIQCAVLYPSLARSIVDLHNSSVADLPLIAEVILQEARRLGLDSLDGTPRFIDQHAVVTKRELYWENKLNQQYKCFGVIQEGDMVIVVEEPVMQNGIVVDLGEVRKVRKPVDK